MALPIGTVTFLFTDIEGSTRLWQAFPEAMPKALERHHALLQHAIESHGGYVFQIVGDAFCAAFHTAHQAVAAALAAQHAMSREPWGETGALRVRMGLHTGTVDVHAGEYRSGEYVSGLTLSRVARLLSAGHGGQILLSQAVEQLARDHLPPDVQLQDLGQRRLRDLVRAEHVFQVIHPDLPRDFPPLKTLDVLPNNLPVQVTTFVGREREVQDVAALLAGNRLLTLVGPGGTGKTRLSLQVGANLAESFPDGVWFVELAPLSDPALVPQALAATLGIREEPGRALRDTIGEYLRERAPLVILDNCEHVIEACAQLAAGLLRISPRLKILTSSREPLGAAGEAVFRVPSLSLPETDRAPSAEQLRNSEAVRLLVERATVVKPGFNVTDENASAVVQICRRLDGIPLAIELAAARLKVLSVQEIAARLDQRFRLLTGGNRTALARHQTLRGLIDWSYELLAESERVMMRRLSIFAGRWDLAAAEAVCKGKEISEADVLELLGRLVDKSLVVAEEHHGETRYGLLETIRQYGREKLSESEEESGVRDAHRDFYLAMAESTEQELYSAQQALWFRRLEDAHDNLRAAIGWSLESRDVDKSLRLGASLGIFWDTHGHISEGRGWLEQVLGKAEGATASSPASVRAKARALDAAARMVIRQSEFARGKELYQQSLDLWRQLGDRGGTAETLNNLGDLLRQLSNPREAKNLIEESLQLFRGIEDKRGIAHALNNLADIVLAEGHREQARRFFEESVPLFRQIRDARGLSHGLNNLGGLLTRLGDYDAAEPLYRESLRLAEELDDKHAVATVQRSLGDMARYRNRHAEAVGHYRDSVDILLNLNDKYCAGKSLVGLAWVAHDTDDLERATSLGEQALALFREVKVPTEITMALSLLGRVALSGRRLERAAELLHESLMTRQAVNDIAAIAATLEDLARIAGAAGNAPRMVKLLGAAAALRQANKIELDASEVRSSEDAVASARTSLDQAAFASAWAQGSALSADDAIALASGPDT